MSTESQLLTDYKIVAVVGLSPNPDRVSNHVAKYMQENGYKIIPVNPGATEILGEKCFPDLLSIGGRVEIVDIFRKSEDVPPIVDQAIQIGARAVWMQEGVYNEAAAEKARKAGLAVVMDKCIMKEHSRLRR